MIHKKHCSVMAIVLLYTVNTSAMRVSTPHAKEETPEIKVSKNQVIEDKDTLKTIYCAYSLRRLNSITYELTQEINKKKGKATFSGYFLSGTFECKIWKPIKDEEKAKSLYYKAAAMYSKQLHEAKTDNMP